MENIPTLLKSRDQHLLGPSLSPKFKQSPGCEVKRGRGNQKLTITASRRSFVYMHVQQAGILSEHALEFARLTEKRLGTSKFSNSIFERFRWVFDLVFFPTQFLLIYRVIG